MKNLEIIDNYYMGNKNLKHSTNSSLNDGNDPELDNLHLNYLIAKEAIQKAGLKYDIAAAQNRYLASQTDSKKTEIPLKVSIWKRPIQIAASVAVVASLGVGVNSVNVGHKDLAVSMDMHFKPFTFRGEADSYQELKYLYNNKEFDKVINKTLSEKKNQDVIFLRAMAYYSNANYGASQSDLALLQTLNSGTSQPSFAYEIQYYIALTNLGMGNISTAYNQLIEIKKDKDNPYKNAISRWDLTRIKILKIKSAK